MSRPCEAWVAACVDAAEGVLEKAFAEHMEQCIACREAVAELCSDLEFIRPGPAPVPGPWLAATIRRAAERKRRRFPRRLVMLAPMAAAAGLLLLLSALSGRFTAPYEISGGGADEYVILGPAPEDTIPGNMDAAISTFVWEEDWGVGVEALLALADTADLKRLLESLPPDAN